jgi:hypothetical protein
MTLAALELNDQSLLIQAEDGALHAEPGFARLTGDGVVTGEEARAVAWREPQHVYNQYWCQLSQAALPSRHRHARHYADIAYAQLRKLWTHAGAPDQLMLLAPGSFADAQLGLLLGMVEALPARADAVIDSALAACLDADRDTLYLDLQMHDAVLTVCRIRDGGIEVAEQEVVPGFGMAQIQNSLARHVSDLMIESYRFDPLHSSETEQAIFDQIPHWLTRLRFDTDVSTRLVSDGNEYACIVNREAARRLVEQRFESVRTLLRKWSSCRLLLSHASGLLCGLVSALEDAEIAGQTAAVQNGLSRQAEILEQVSGTCRVQRLARPGATPVEDAVNGEALATHLLCGDTALPLRRPVSIRLDNGSASASNELDDGAALTVVLRNRSLELLRPARDAELPPRCLPGASIRLAGHEFRLIRVRDD